MSRLLDAYRACWEQAFMPIFVADGFEPRMLVDACLDAGMKGIEYTLRKPDADKMIPWIREHYPELYLFVGSTIDDDNIVRRQRQFYPQLMTIAELEAFHPDGYISMLGWHEASIRKYSPKRILMPTASTVNEALFQVGAGACFAKIMGNDMNFVRRLRGQAAFDYCPIIVTGGMTPDRIPEAVDAGAAMIASGFDLTLKGETKNVSPRKVTEVMKHYMQVTQEARAKKWPNVPGPDADMRTWLDALPHYHPF